MFPDCCEESVKDIVNNIEAWNLIRLHIAVNVWRRIVKMMVLLREDMFFSDFILQKHSEMTNKWIKKSIYSEFCWFPNSMLYCCFYLPTSSKYFHYILRKESRSLNWSPKSTQWPPFREPLVTLKTITLVSRLREVITESDAPAESREEGIGTRELW